ncbi:MAG TPA: class I SAM-dependent methyltransferase [Roseiarcus sp.]|nr:class I SAM-dependent methyltransferase [Roseiarcus sp.]
MTAQSIAPEPDHGLGPSASAVWRAVASIWPEHEKFLRASFADRSPDVLQTTEIIADLLLQVSRSTSRDMRLFAEDYRYLCEKIVYPEELFFAREGRYRLQTFEEADREVYSNPAVMDRYMNGLFMSDALWFNHASAMNDFATAYLPRTVAGGRHLEIGPGHGMLLHLALRFGAFASLSAWDVSETSVLHVQSILRMLGEAERVDLQLMDLYSERALAENRGRFDTVVLSEVLEHLERPRLALEIIRELLAPNGAVWINVPANGPAPDHLFLLRSPVEAEEVVRSAGLKIVRAAAFPIAGATLERALRKQFPISCVLVAKRA